jgi:hypothetical protein
MNTASAMTDCVYILASGHHGTLYVGVMNDLQRRVEQHRSKDIPGFTRRFGVTPLVHVQRFGDTATRSTSRSAWSAGGGLEDSAHRGGTFDRRAAAGAKMRLLPVT